MPDDRRGPLVIGALAAVTGGVLFLAAGDVLPVPDKTFGAPRWLAALLGLAVFFGGSYIVSLVLPTPWTRRLPGAAAILSFITMSALLMTLKALTAPRLILGAFAWTFALLMDAVAVAVWVVTIRVLLRRPSP